MFSIRKIFNFDSPSDKYNRCIYFSYNDLGVISIIEPKYFNILRAFEYFKKAGFCEFGYGQNNLGLFYQFYLEQTINAEHMFERSSKNDLCLAYYNLGYLREKENKIEDAMRYYLKASEDEDKDLFLNNERFFDQRYEISKTLIIFMTNLKICLYYFDMMRFDKAKEYFVHAFTQLEKKYQKYKFVFGIKEDCDNKFSFQFNKNDKMDFSYLRTFIFNFPLFNLKNQKNISNDSMKKYNILISGKEIEQTKQTKSFERKKQKYSSKKKDIGEHFEYQEIDCNAINDPSQLFDAELLNLTITKYFINEIRTTVEMIENILYTPPYPILFGRIWLSKKKQKIKKINEMFYEGFGIDYQND